jgi:tRNA-modifying protein YgfZ
MVKDLHKLQDISTGRGSRGSMSLPVMFSVEQYRALHEGAGLVNRSGRGRLRLTGADRRPYLQGILTNDIAALTSGTGCYAALLTAQGRMISDMYVHETGEAILLDLERVATEKVLAHLDLFIISEDVQVADASDSVAQLGLYGPNAAAIVAAVLGRDPSEIEALRLFENRTWAWSGAPVVAVRRDDLGVPGVDLFVERSQEERLADALRESGAIDVPSAAAEVSRIEAGHPVFGVDMTDDTIPLEAGIEDRAISLTKGCYVGQEIIIRVLHRGHGRVARRLVGLVLDDGSPVPSRGDLVRSGARDIGRVTSAVHSVALQRPIALAYVHRDYTEPNTVVSVVSGDSAFAAVVAARPIVIEGAAVPQAVQSARNQPAGSGESSGPLA